MFLTTKQKVVLSFEILVISLACIALIAELLPEIHAKMIVIPTLILVIALGTLSLKQKRPHDNLF